MVVLSACNTGAGQLAKGEGIMSLTRGFVYAGVPSIVMTNWEVNDETGSIIMGHFYDNLRNGDAKDVALQKAKIEYLTEANQLKSHPYFWSAYVLVGDSTPLVKKGLDRSYVFYLTAFVLLIIMLLLLARNKKKRKY
jgi:CHAT domain-containing protein